MTRIGLAIVWILRLLPLPLLALLGRMTGLLLYCIARERRKVVQTNLALCFPQWSEAERTRVAQRHFQCFARSLLEHGILWWSSQQRVERLVRIVGLEYWQAVRGEPVIWFAPHFIGLDMGGVRLATEYAAASVYSQQKDPHFDAILLHGRSRFVPQELYSRQQGIRPLIRAMRAGRPFYYLPDMDFGERDSVFVPFFGVPAATITGLARIAQLAGAKVVPSVTTQLPGGAGYELRFYPAWENFPSGDALADARRMNEFIEERVRENPEQYYWLHKRFKTRPPGEKSYYS
jgi:KDO2-lipid IV(A) lauroyltransferase